MFVISFAKAFLIEKVNRGGWVVSDGAILSVFGLMNAYPDLIIRRLEAVSKDVFKIQVEIWKGKLTTSWVFNAMEHEIKIVNEWIIAVHNNGRLQIEITNSAIKAIALIEEGSQTQGKMNPIQNLKVKELIVKQIDRQEELDEKTKVARNLLDFYKKAEGKLVRFTLLDYEKFLGRALEESERRVVMQFLEYLVGWRALSPVENGQYSFTDKFVEYAEVFGKLAKNTTKK
ncbi:MAG: hypothetical protein Q7S19_03840 [bacterium]|nr:hypothetical protein [bacterium]